MPRNARKQSKTDVYHIMLRGNNKQQIFLDEDDSKQFLRILLYYKEICDYKIYAYCLMGNHLHLLLKINETPLESVMKRLVTKFVYYYNTKYSRIGHLFQDRYKSEPVENDEYLLQAVRYIHQNPIKAGICAKPEDYVFSSYSEYMCGQAETEIADTEFVLGIMPKPKLIEFHKQTDNSIKFIDTAKSTKRLTEPEAISTVKEVYKKCQISDLNQCNKQYQKDIVALLKTKGLSVRQIERLTGVSHWIAQKG